MPADADHENDSLVRTAQVIVLSGDLSGTDITAIKNYCINPVEAREASLEPATSLELAWEKPADVPTVEGFISMDDAALTDLSSQMGLAMSFDDLKFVQTYFRDEEKRNPTITEIRVIDTYWSDHCRHTTFMTELTDVSFEKGTFTAPIQRAYESYKTTRKNLNRKKPQTLMDMATIAVKELKAAGKLDNLDESEEINACTIIIPVDVDGVEEEWLLLFKNETHNHPTEIEPFGGAATCLGGCIRDPLSGRSYVYQAMRVTGAGDPRQVVQDTLVGKLPQRKLRPVQPKATAPMATRSALQRVKSRNTIIPDSSPSEWKSVPSSGLLRGRMSFVKNPFPRYHHPPRRQDRPRRLRRCYGLFEETYR